jgi:galactose oxidase-like protein
MKTRMIVILAGLGAGLTLLCAAISWKDILQRWNVFRLTGNPELQEAWCEKPADSIEGRAVRTYFQERPAGVVRLVISFPLNDAVAYSPKDRSWRNIPMPAGVILGREPRVGWTGKEFWIWGGDLEAKESEGAPQPSAGLLDIHTGAWKPFPGGGPSPRRSPICAWTGKELLVVGGENPPRFFNDAWAFNPATWSWRRLDNFPRSR